MSEVKARLCMVVGLSGRNRFRKVSSRSHRNTQCSISGGRESIVGLSSCRGPAETAMRVDSPHLVCARGPGGMRWVISHMLYFSHLSGTKHAFARGAEHQRCQLAGFRPNDQTRPYSADGAIASLFKAKHFLSLFGISTVRCALRQKKLDTARI